jgi:hypothetical protein
VWIQSRLSGKSGARTGGESISFSDEGVDVHAAATR